MLSKAQNEQHSYKTPLQEPVKVLPYDEAKERTEVYRKLFTKELNFKEVNVHFDLPKDEIIKELQGLKHRASTTKEDEFLSIAIVNIGFYLDLNINY